MFRPERVVYVCPEDIGSGKARSCSKAARLFPPPRAGAGAEFRQGEAFYEASAMLDLFRGIVEQYPDCAIDITGGTDAALFAAGLLCAETNIQVVTYSRRKNCFYNIRGAAFAGALPCDGVYTVEDFFLMAGGSMRQGRVDNAILSQYLADIDPFFQLYLRHRRGWTSTVIWMQRVSQAAAGRQASA